MISNELKKFMALGQLLSPTLIDEERCGQPDITDEQATVCLRLEEKFPIGSVMDMLEDELGLSLLYHGTHKDEKHIHECCFFANPLTSQLMYKINASTDKAGFADAMTLTVFDSIEVWEQALEEDLSTHADTCDFLASIDKHELLSLFCKLDYGA